MSDNNAKVDELFSMLRRLAAEQPREARAHIGQLLDDQPGELRHLLIRMSAPGEGRLRHIVANLIVAKVERVHAVPQLETWLKVETDEFTKKALLKAAEATKNLRSRTREARAVVRPVDEHLVEAYRYAASRLSHQMRNALMRPHTTLLKFKREATDPSADLAKYAEQLSADLRLVSRIIEFDTTDEYFQMRSVPICDWLAQMNDQYAKTFVPLGLDIVADARCRAARVYANEQLLGLIFRNLWANAHDAVGNDCIITVHLSSHDTELHILVLDNGVGLSPEARDAAFEQAYSGGRHMGHSGKGLLEVQEAAGQLHGVVEIVEHQHQYRVLVKLPTDVT